MKQFRRLKAPKGLEFDKVLIKDDRAIAFYKRRRMRL